MRLLLIIAILLFQKSTVTEQRKKCWIDYVQGRCRKVCKVTEIRELLCKNGGYCCLSIKEVEARKRITNPPRPKPITYALTLPQDYDTPMENISSPNPDSP
ncbi:beta-defensin 127 [Elephas maximus indicus]|uniref:beta-defensin 127 n=1 Tax=Elephas maximus indicus TaxID=99487 RepID=UPI0021163B67|nr:beta-defensin 127 [Elephas maximus indicus]